MIRILLNGAAGKMGRSMAAAIVKENDMRIAAAVDVQCVGMDAGDLAGIGPLGVKVEEDLAAAIGRREADVMLDFTNPQVIMKNLRIALSLGLPCVVGTTGLTPADREEVQALSLAHQAPVFVTANFALTAVLMMKYAADAVKYFPSYEVVEMHNDKKMDAPSGTALTTVAMMNQNREAQSQGGLDQYEILPGCRGGDAQGARVHSVRLPGIVAIQEVIFGGPGQMLTIRHDAISRECFFPGVALALRKIDQLHGLVEGLEQLL